MSMIKELWTFLRVRKKIWMWPIFGMMAPASLVIGQRARDFHPADA